MQNLIELYQDPLFVLFPIYSWIISLGAFLMFALPYSWIAWKDPARLIRHRIQKRRMPAEKVFWPSLIRLAINSVCTLVVAILLWPLLRLSGVHAGELPHWYEVAWQLPFFLMVDDFGFYFLHRMLHTRWLYKHVHTVHHRIFAPWAIAGGYFHPVEYTLITFVALIGPLLAGAHVVTIWMWAVFRQWEAAEGHSGYELPWNPTRWLPGYEGPAFHDFHHAGFVGNYANYFGYLDRWLGTESPGYRDYRRDVQAAG